MGLLLLRIVARIYNPFFVNTFVGVRLFADTFVDENFDRKSNSSSIYKKAPPCIGRGFLWILEAADDTEGERGRPTPIPLPIWRGVDTFGGRGQRQLTTPSEVSKAVRAAITIWMMALMMSFFMTH